MSLLPVLLASLVSTTPALRPEAWWKGAFDFKRDFAATNLDAQVAFVGDSITARWGMKEGADAWKRHFRSGKYKAVQFGIGGDRTEHVLWRLLNGQLGEFRPKVFVLEIGTNNTGHRAADEETPIDTIRGIRRIVEVMRCHWPEAKIVLHPIFPRGERAGDPLRVRNARVNDEIRYLADGTRVIWCDFNAKFLGADGTLSREMMGDFVHPTAKGMGLWAESLLPALDYALGLTKTRPEGAVAPPRPKAKADEPSVSGWFDYRLSPKRGEIEAKASKHYDVVFLGDSITHLWEERAVDVQREFLGEYEILNLGFSGDRTQNTLWGCENGLLDGYRADFVSIMIGTNNRQDSAEDVARAIGKIVASVRAHQPTARVLLFNIFPCGERTEAKERAKAAAVNALIRKLDNGKSVRFVTLWDEFIEPDGTISTSVLSDYLHLTAEGYAIWARKLASELKRGG